MKQPCKRNSPPDTQVSVGGAGGAPGAWADSPAAPAEAAVPLQPRESMGRRDPPGIPGGLHAGTGKDLYFIFSALSSWGGDWECGFCGHPTGSSHHITLKCCEHQTLWDNVNLTGLIQPIYILFTVVVLKKLSGINYLYYRKTRKCKYSQEDLRLTCKWVLILWNPWDVKHSLVSYIFVSLGALCLKEQSAYDFKIILYSPPLFLHFAQICRLSFCKLRICKHKYSLFFRLCGTNCMNSSYFNWQETPLSSVTFRWPKVILLITDSNNF